MRKLLIPAFVIILASCGKSNSADTDPVAVDNIEVAPRDSALFHLGHKHGRHLVDHHQHPDSIGEQLLEIRGRETEIRRRVDDAAADAYLVGFIKAVKEYSPALADSIF